MNKLKPGIIQKISTSGGDYKMMDNISQFQRAATYWGVGDVDLFNANDLYDQKNIALVTQTIFAVARAVSYAMMISLLIFIDSFLSATSIQNSEDHSWAPDHQKKTSATSPKTS